MIFSIAALCLVMIFMGAMSYEALQRQVANYYYDQAEQAMYEFNNEKSTEYILKAIDWEPEASSPEYAEFQRKRSEFLANEENKKKYLGE